MSDAPMHALDAASPVGLSPEEKLVWILGDLMNATENYFGAVNPKRRGHINSAAIRIIDEVLTPVASENDRLREALAELKGQWERMLENYASADARAERAEAERDRLREALIEAREDVAHWGGYASDYFKEKHDLGGDLARIDAALAKEAGK